MSAEGSLLEVVVEALVEKMGIDVLALDIRGLTDYADTLVIVSGSSDRQVKAMSDAVEEAARGFGERPTGIEGYVHGQWVLQDYGDLVIHIFHDPVRAHFDLEGLWGEAPHLPLALPTDAPRRLVTGYRL